MVGLDVLHARTAPVPRPAATRPPRRQPPAREHSPVHADTSHACWKLAIHMRCCRTARILVQQCTGGCIGLLLQWCICTRAAVTGFRTCASNTTAPAAEYKVTWSGDTGSRGKTFRALAHVSTPAVPGP